MKVAFCAYDRPGWVASGPNVWLRRLAADLGRAGVDVHAYVIHCGPAGECPTIRGLQDLGIACACLDGEIEPHTEQHVRWFLDQVRRTEPDVFVANLVTPALYAARWIRRAGIPTVAVLHSWHPFYREVIRSFVGGLPEWRVNAAVAVSKALADAATAAAGDGVRVERIPCGVPVPGRRALAPEGELKLLYAGRLAQEAKRIRDIASSLCETTRRHQDVTATILGAGPEEESVRDILRRQARPGAARLAPPVAAEVIQDEMIRHHVFVMMSDYEGMPIALMEAMACGLVPVCLAEESGVGQILRHEVNGLIVRDRGDDFHAAIARLRSEAGLWQRLSDGARKTVIEEYASSVTSRRWLDLVAGLASGRARRRRALQPLCLHLPPVEEALRCEDRRLPPPGDRMGQWARQRWDGLRQALRPRARWRAFRSRNRA